MSNDPSLQVSYNQSNLGQLNGINQGGKKSLLSQRIYLTKKANQMSEKYAQKEQAFMELLYKDISDDEIRTVYKIISKMEENLKSHAEDKEGSL